MLRRPDPAAAKKLKDFLATSGLKWRESQTSYIFTCPRCRKEEKLWMFKADGQFICFYCAEIEGFKGRPEFALADLMNTSVANIRKELYGYEAPQAVLFLDVELEDWWSNDEKLPEVPDLTKNPTKLWGPSAFPIEHKLSAKGAEYLAGRGVSIELAQKYGIRYSGVEQRVLIPIQYHGKLFGWQARLIGPTEVVTADGRVKKIPKILTTPEGLKKAQMLMFADNLDGAKQAIITEGPFDGIKCDGCHEPGEKAGNVVTMGMGVSEAQINLIRYSGVTRVYLGLDPDAAQNTERLVQAFNEYLEVYIMEPPRGFDDFGQMEVDAVTEVWRTAKPAMRGAVYVYLNPEYPLYNRPKRIRPGT